MRISDWSSDVCSSDLLGGLWRVRGALVGPGQQRFAAFLHLGPAIPQDRLQAAGGASHRLSGAALARAVAVRHVRGRPWQPRSEEHTSELQSLMRISYAVFCLKKKNKIDIKMSHKTK